MLTNVTFSLPEKTVKRLRRYARDSGKKKGVISELVDAAIRKYLEELAAPIGRQTFTAFRGEKAVAQAKSLDELATALKSRGVDPRSVKILSSEPLEPVGRIGLRVRTQ